MNCMLYYYFTMESLNAEYDIAIKLISTVKNLDLKIDYLFLTPAERHELIKLCVDVRTSFNWNFKFQEFYETIINCHCTSLEFYWILHVCQVMSFETYILSLYSQNSTLQKFTENILKLCAEDFEESDAQYLTQTGIFTYIICKAFPIKEVIEDEKIKEICMGVIRSLLQDIFPTGEDEMKNRRFSCFFALWVAGVLEEQSLSDFCSFALDFYLDFHPTANDLDAFELLEHSRINVSTYQLLTVIQKLVKIQKSDRITHFLKCAAQKNQINARALLVIVKAYLETHKDASTSISKLVSESMNEAYDKSSYAILLRSLLIGYQASCMSNISPHIHYRLWLQTVFKECSRAKDKNSFSLLIQVLSDFVPYYKDIEYIRVAIDSNFAIPSEFQSMYDDYIILLKTRFQDLKPSTKQDVTVEKALSLFESLHKIPPVVLEISLLQKHIFINEFLPALLVPRVVPPVPDVREKFIEALYKAGKIPSSVLQKYKEACLEKQNKIIEEEFIYKIKNTHITSDTMLAILDIVSLYPSIDTEEVINNIGVAIDNRENLSSNIKTIIESYINMIDDDFDEDDCI